MGQVPAERLQFYIDNLGTESRTVTKVVAQSKRRDRVSVFVGGEFAFGILAEVAERHGIRAGSPIDGPRLNAVRRDEQTASCKRVALRYLSYRMRSEHEIRARLATEGVSDETIDQVLTQLRDLDLVDDAAFASAFARDAATGRKWGPHRIARGLRKAGVALPVVAQALEEVRHLQEDQEVVETLAKKRWRQLSNIDDPMKRKKRVYDYLLRRGFDFADVRRAVDELSGLK